MKPLVAFVAAHPAWFIYAGIIACGLLVAAAWAGHTDRSRAVALCIKGAIQALGWTHDYAASFAGMAREEFDHALAGRKALSIHRLANLPDEFWAEFDKRRVALRGGKVLEADDVQMVRGFAEMPRRAMLHMTHPVPQEYSNEKTG